MNLENEILELEQQSKLLEPNQEQRHSMLEKVNHYTDLFLSDIEERKAFDDDFLSDDGMAEYKISKEGKPLDEILKFLKKEVDTPGINPASGGHVGYIPGGGIYTTALADYMVDITNRYAGVFFGNPGAVRMENYLLRWMCGLMGYPSTALGNLTSGGSIANLIAITTARDAKEINSKIITKSVIYLTEQTHHCVQKAIRIAGLSEAVIHYIPMDNGFRMDSDKLETKVQEDIANGLLPFLVVASAGTTDVGAMDPLRKIGEICKINDMWYHIDAAYGGFFILVDELKPLFDGISMSDSIAIDPHKGLFLSYGLGAVLIKDVKALQESHKYKASYMQDTLDKNLDLSPAELSPELTKHFRGMRMWLSLQHLGLEPFKNALREKYLLTKYFCKKIEAMGFEVGIEPELSVAIYRFKPEDENVNSINKSLIEEIHKDGRVFISSTTLNGNIWLRMAILCFRTHKKTIDKCLQMIEDCVGRI